MAPPYEEVLERVIRMYGTPSGWSNHEDVRELHLVKLGFKFSTVRKLCSRLRLCTNLHTLDLSNNKISGPFPTISLPFLKVLRLHGNPSVPVKSLALFQSLETLTLAGQESGQVTDLYIAIYLLPRLQEVDDEDCRGVRKRLRGLTGRMNVEVNKWIPQHFNSGLDPVKALEELTHNEETRLQFYNIVKHFSQSHSLNEELKPFLRFLFKDLAKRGIQKYHEEETKKQQEEETKKQLEQKTRTSCDKNLNVVHRGEEDIDGNTLVRVVKTPGGNHGLINNDRPSSSSSSSSTGQSPTPPGPQPGDIEFSGCRVLAVSRHEEQPITPSLPTKRPTGRPSSETSTQPITAQKEFPISQPSVRDELLQCWAAMEVERLLARTQSDATEVPSFFDLQPPPSVRVESPASEAPADTPMGASSVYSVILQTPIGHNDSQMVIEAVPDDHTGGDDAEKQASKIMATKQKLGSPKDSKHKKNSMGKKKLSPRKNASSPANHSPPLPISAKRKSRLRSSDSTSQHSMCNICTNVNLDDRCKFCETNKSKKPSSSIFDAVKDYRKDADVDDDNDSLYTAEVSSDEEWIDPDGYDDGDEDGREKEGVEEEMEKKEDNFTKEEDEREEIDWEEDATTDVELQKIDLDTNDSGSEEVEEDNDSLHTTEASADDEWSDGDVDVSGNEDGKGEEGVEEETEKDEDNFTREEDEMEAIGWAWIGLEEDASTDGELQKIDLDTNDSGSEEYVEEDNDSFYTTGARSDDEWSDPGVDVSGNEDGKGEEGVEEEIEKKEGNFTREEDEREEIGLLLLQLSMCNVCAMLMSDERCTFCETNTRKKLSSTVFDEVTDYRKDANKDDNDSLYTAETSSDEEWSDPIVEVSGNEDEKGEEGVEEEMEKKEGSFTREEDEREEIDWEEDASTDGELQKIDLDTNDSGSEEEEEDNDYVYRPEASCDDEWCDQDIDGDAENEDGRVEDAEEEFGGSEEGNTREEDERDKDASTDEKHPKNYLGTNGSGSEEEEDRDKEEERELEHERNRRKMVEMMWKQIMIRSDKEHPKVGLGIDASKIPETPTASFLRPKNIKDIRVRSTVPSITDSASKGFHPCGKCSACLHKLHKNGPFTHTIRSNTFQSATNGSIHNIKFSLSCDSQNVVYLITCNRCGMQYVGETGRKAKTRLLEHCADARIKKNTHVGNHFNLPSHTEDNITFIVIDKPSRCNTRQTLEHHWIETLQTIIPYGLNAW